MAVYFVGTTYNGESVLDEFVSKEGVFIGYSESEAMPLYRMLFKLMSIGDFVVAKGYSPSNGLYIKAIGMCMSDEKIHSSGLGFGRPVKWLWQGNDCLGVIRDSYTNMRTGTIYEENNTDVIKIVLEKLFK